MGHPGVPAAGVGTDVKVTITGAGVVWTHGIVKTDNAAGTMQAGNQTSLSSWDYPALTPGNYVFQCLVDAVAGSVLNVAVTPCPPVVNGPSGITLNEGVAPATVHGMAFAHFAI